MSDLTDLYQQLIIDNSQHPHNFCVLADPNHTTEGHNPLCGDNITVYVKEKDGYIVDVSFQGSGCAISTASASLMTDAIKGKTVTEALEIFEEFQKLVTGGNPNPEKLGKLVVLAGVAEFPMRVKCATLAWHTLKAALTNDTNKISTE